MDFVDQVALELSQEDENISKWLNHHNIFIGRGVNHDDVASPPF